MKKLMMIFLLFPLLLTAQEKMKIGVLFDSLKTHPVVKSDELNMELALANKSMATGKLFPRINLFGQFDYSSSPNGMKPLVPNEMFPMIKDQSIPQPFSERIYRGGGTVSMPVFVKSIFTLSSKAQMMYESAKAKRYITLLQNEAIVVIANSNLIYLNNLDKALLQKKKSLEKTKEIIDIKVKNGRAPASALLIINNAINQIGIKTNEIALNRENAFQMIYSLTGIKLNTALNMTQTGNYEQGEMKALEPIKNKLEADRLGLRAEKEKLWPVLVLNGNYNHSYAKAYNNNLDVNEDFTTVALTFSMPLFAMDQYASISKSRVVYEETRNTMNKLSLELKAQAKQLINSYPLLTNSIELYKNSIKDKKEILKIAKVSYGSGRISIEDYLKYEDDLVLEESNLYKAQAEKWQIVMKLAVIYGNNIEDIVR